MPRLDKKHMQRKKKRTNRICLCEDSVNKVINTALVLLTDETKVTVLTPAVTPRVLDEPVLLAVVLTITSKKNTVVKSGTADDTEDTTEVELPESGINTNGQRTDVIKSSDHIDISAINCTPVRELVKSLAAVIRAGTSLGLVRILVLSGHTFTDTIGHGIGHKATITGTIANLLALVLHAVMITINKLLLREDRKFTMSNLVDTLHIASNREGPAATAVALVLDRSHSTIFNPVLLLRIILKSLLGRRQERTTRDVGGELVKITSSELLRGKISKLVKSETSTVRFVLVHLVQLKNSALVLSENKETLTVFLTGNVFWLILTLPVLPFLIDRVDQRKG